MNTGGFDQWSDFNAWPRNTRYNFPISFKSIPYVAVANDKYTSSDGFLSVLALNIQSESEVLLNCCRVNQDHEGSACWGAMIVIGA